MPWEIADIVLRMTPSRVLLISRAVGKHLVFGTLFSLPLCAIVLPAAAQAPASAPANPPGKRLTFDAASVRPSSPQQGGLKGIDFLPPSSHAAPPPGGLFSWNAPISWLINFAYDLHTNALIQEAHDGLPKPLQDFQKSFFAVEARADGNPTRDDVRQMVRSLLEDRFQYRAHIEKRDGQVYALEVLKPGLGLKPHAEGAPCALSPAQTNVNTYPHVYPSYEQLPARCGIFNRELSRAGERRLEMLDVTMQQITETLTQQEQLGVVDRTGLDGHFDAVLDFSHGGVPAANDPGDEVGAPMLPAALEKQLGLKLEKQNAQVDVFVTDHAGTLSEN